MNETTIKINKTESWFFVKIKILTRLQWTHQKKERKKEKSNKQNQK